LTVRERAFSIAFCLVLSVSALTSHAAAPATAPADLARVEAFTKQVRPQLQKYCFECHGDGSSAGELDMDELQSGAVAAARPTWLKMIRHVRSQVMPPPEAELQPTQAQRDELVSLLQRQLFDPSKPDPGRTTLRRLNRTEYRNSIRDLLGVSFDPTLDFPQDDTGYGFDNIADVLTLPPMLMEKYLHAAEKILDEAVPTDEVERVERHVDATEATTTFRDRAAHTNAEGWVSLSSNQEDALSFFTDSTVHGEYVVRVLAYAKYPDKPPIGFTEHPPLRLSVILGDTVARELDVHTNGGDPKWHEARVSIPPGRQLVRVALRRTRGPREDRSVSDGRLGVEQPGEAFVKEIALIGPVSGAVRRIGPDRMQLSGTAARSDYGVNLHKTDERATATIDVPADGKYVLRALASADYAGDEPARMEFSLDDKALATFDVTAPAALMSVGAAKDLSQRARRAVPRVYDVTKTLKAGQHKLTARYLNNLKQDDAPDPNYRDRNIHLGYFEYVELSAPVLSPPMTEPMRRLFAKHGAMKNAGDAQARAVLADFARRAWRRPPGDADVDRLMKLYALARTNGEHFSGSVKHAMKAVLVSPHFLFRGVDALAARDSDQPQPISEFELASRLSYFLWSTTPDEELLSLAERSELRKNLDGQVKRMLASEKSREFVDNFAGQWLQFRNLDAAHPDEKKFEKQYDDRLRDAMKRETQLFFQSILKNDASLLDVLVGDYTFLNERLAKHYGIDGVTGEQFRRVSLKGTPRRGVLTQGSVLTLTSNPTRTSPVKRGKYVLQNLLGVEPPPPPPNVPPLVAEGKELTGTLRQRLEKHREDPMCSSCHAPMDPIGFGLENFDAIGRWRDKDGKLDIDSSSEFVSGDKFSGAKELTALLAKTRQNDFYRSVAENALTFALGRGVEPFDQPAVDKIVDELKKNDGKVSTLISGVIDSTPFQMRRGGNNQPDQSVAEVPFRRSWP
jgi:mono/diheme cytochrome c family protein